MKRSLLICLSALLALGAVAVTALAMESRSNDGTAPAETAIPLARVAVAHLAPFSTTTAVDVKVDGFAVLSDFEFGDSTPYVSPPFLVSGTHLIEIYPAGGTVPVLTRTVDLEARDYTVIAVGGANEWDLDLLLLEDDNTAPPGGELKARIGHLAPFADTEAGTLADVRLQDGTPVLPMSVGYGTYTDFYAPLDAGEYDLKITAPGGSPTLIDPMPATFDEGDILSVFAVGDGDNQPLGVFVLPSDEEGFFLSLAASLQVAHLAPFAPDPGTAVDVSIDGVIALPDFAFGDSTGYLPLEADVDHLIEIAPAGGGPVVLSTTVNLTHPLDYTAIAVGGANEWDLDLLLLEDDNTAPPGGELKARIGHLAPFADTGAGTLADVRLQDGTPVLPMSVGYGTYTDFYAPLDAGEYDLKITAPGGSPTLIDPMPATFDEGDILSVFAVGDGDNQPLGVFVLPSDEEGFFLSLAASLQVAHLAPFAPDPGTAVDVSIDSTQVLTNFAFADSTGYLPLQADVDHLIEIAPAGGGPVVLSTTVNLTHPLDYTAIAVGGANEWDLDLELLEDDNTPPEAGMFRIRAGHIAPFASTITDTLADLRLQDGTLLLGNVPYGAVDTLPELSAGPYDLKITAPGGSPTLIDPFMATFEEGDILSLFAVGDGDNQPLGVFALPSGEPGFLLPLARYQWLPFVAKDATP